MSVCSSLSEDDAGFWPPFVVDAGDKALDTLETRANQRRNKRRERRDALYSKVCVNGPRMGHGSTRRHVGGCACGITSPRPVKATVTDRLTGTCVWHYLSRHVTLAECAARVRQRARDHADDRVLFLPGSVDDPACSWSHSELRIWG